MKIFNGQWMEIFRTGDYGTKGYYTNSDLDDIITNFHNSGAVPIVLGHPKDNGPVHGWLMEIKRRGEVIIGKLGNLHDNFVKDVAEGKYRNRSVRIVLGATGARLEHLGFLGAMLPEVSGLKQIEQFSSDWYYVCDFSYSSCEDFTRIQDNGILVDLSHCV
jgi:hypothetical protein